MYSVHINYRDVEYDILRGEMRQIFIPTWPAIYQGSTLHVLGKDLERNVFYYLQLFAKNNPPYLMQIKKKNFWIFSRSLPISHRFFYL